MTVWRWGLALALTLGVGVPLLPPFLGLADPAAWKPAAGEADRLLTLTGNTLLLVVGTLSLALPVGVSLAMLLFRTRVPGRRLGRLLLLLLLFVPLPVAVSAWQALLGPAGLLPVAAWRSPLDRPWATGLIPAIWVYAASSVPWIAWVVGLGLRAVEPELEEEALQQVPPWRVLALVTLPRVRAALLAAALLVAVTTANDVTVSGQMLIPTYAEEVHTQFVLNRRAALARVLVLFLPWTIAVWGLMGLTVWRLERTLPPLPALTRASSPALPLPRWPSAAVVWVSLGVLLVPMGALVWKLGVTGESAAWSAATAWSRLCAEANLYLWRSDPWRETSLAGMAGAALLTGLLVAALALVCCWLAAESAALRAFLIALLTFAWALPDPVIGIGLHDTIRALPPGPWDGPLYHGPSPLPVLWVQAMRFLPVATFFLWPVVRLLPPSLRDTARLHGAAPLSELLHLVVPLTGRATLVTGLAVAALCLGEVGASIRVETPGWETFTKLLFDRMHYGADADVAALCVLMLGGLATVAVVAWAGLWMVRRQRVGAGRPGSTNQG